MNVIRTRGDNHKAKDARYDEYAADCGYGMQEGNPPDSHRLDEEIQRFSEEFPEMSEAEREQIDFERAAFEQGPRESFPEYEGPGFTEPPLNWVAPGEHDGWTFDQWAEEHGYSRAQIDGINEEFAWGWSYPAPNTFINGEWHEGLEPPKAPEADQDQRLP